MQQAGEERRPVATNRERKEFVYEGRPYGYEFERREIEFEGLTRSYCLYRPDSLDPAKPAPLVLVLHGGSGSSEATLGLTLGRFNELADRDGFIVVYPDGVENIWNDGSGIVKWRAHREQINDVGFLTSLVDRLEEEFHVDPTRVYATGMSLGGMMCFRLACEVPDRIAAIAAVSCGMWEGMPERCAPSLPTPVMMIRGTADPMVPWNGGLTGITRLTGNFMTVLSGPEVARFWAARNGCSQPPAVEYGPDPAPGDGTRVRRESFRGDKPGTEVILYAIEGGGHTWPGGYQWADASVMGPTCRDIDASDVIWELFKRHRRAQVRP
jgi:polyhydroxybutyrate depolymerase